MQIADPRESANSDTEIFAQSSSHSHGRRVARAITLRDILRRNDLKVFLVVPFATNSETFPDIRTKFN